LLRAKYFLEKILLKHHGDCVLLVGHDSINRNLVSVLTGQVLPERIRNASVSIFEVDELGKAKVEIFDSVEHLD